MLINYQSFRTQNFNLEIKTKLIITIIQQFNYNNGYKYCTALTVPHKLHVNEKVIIETIQISISDIKNFKLIYLIIIIYSKTLFISVFK